MDHPDESADRMTAVLALTEAPAPVRRIDQLRVQLGLQLEQAHLRRHPGPAARTMRRDEAIAREAERVLTRVLIERYGLTTERYRLLDHAERDERWGY